MIRLLFVCTGNICRSPTAEAVARAVSDRFGLDWRVDSAGTGRWHVGERPDVRAIAAGASRGYDLRGLRARQLERRDFYEFDRLIALDSMHLSEMRRMRPSHSTAQLSLMLDWAEDVPEADVPDPYYGDETDFDLVIDLVERAVMGMAGQYKPLTQMMPGGQAQPSG